MMARGGLGAQTRRCFKTGADHTVAVLYPVFSAYQHSSLWQPAASPPDATVSDHPHRPAAQGADQKSTDPVLHRPQSSTSRRASPTQSQEQPETAPELTFRPNSHEALRVLRGPANLPVRRAARPAQPSTVRTLPTGARTSTSAPRPTSSCSQAMPTRVPSDTLGQGRLVAAPSPLAAFGERLEAEDHAARERQPEQQRPSSVDARSHLRQRRRQRAQLLPPAGAEERLHLLAPTR